MVLLLLLHRHWSVACSLHLQVLAPPLLCLLRVLQQQKQRLLGSSIESSRVHSAITHFWLDTPSQTTWTS